MMRFMQAEAAPRREEDDDIDVDLLDYLQTLTLALLRRLLNEKVEFRTCASPVSWSSSSSA